MGSRFATVNFPDQIDGDTFSVKQVNFLDDDAAPIDLSDVTPKMQIRKGSYNGKLVRTLVIGDGLTWEDQSLGQIRFGNVPISWGGAGDYYYDLQFTYSSGVVRTYLRGKIVVIDDSTV